MNRLNITLLCVVMLLAGWLARGILDVHAVDGEVDRRLTACITWGISSGLLSVGGDAGDDAVETDIPSTGQEHQGFPGIVLRQNRAAAQ